MPSLPTLMPTRASNETFGGVTYHIDGELVPVLTIDVSMRPVFKPQPASVFVER